MISRRCLAYFPFEHPLTTLCASIHTMAKARPPGAPSTRHWCPGAPIRGLPPLPITPYRLLASAFELTGSWPSARGLSTLRWHVALTPRPKKSGRFQLTVFLCNVSGSSTLRVLSTPPSAVHDLTRSKAFLVRFDLEKVLWTTRLMSKRLYLLSVMYRSLPYCNLSGRGSGAYNACLGFGVRRSQSISFR